MTTYTDHGLVCPDPADYGAVALLIQADALATDSALSGITTSLNSLYTQPYALFVTNTGNGPLSSGGEQHFSQGNWTISSSRGITVTLAGAPLTGVVARLNITTTGWYEYGNYVNLLASGAVTAFSRREIFASAWDLDVTTAVPVRQSEVRWRTVDNNVPGGEFLVASGGTFYAAAGSIIILTAQWSHANLASNVSSLAGAQFWVNYVGTGIELGSA